MSDRPELPSEQPTDPLDELERLTVRLRGLQSEMLIVERAREHAVERLLGMRGTSILPAQSPFAIGVEMSRWLVGISPTQRSEHHLIFPKQVEASCKWTLGFSPMITNPAPRASCVWCSTDARSKKRDEEPTAGERETAEIVRAAGRTVDKVWLAQRLNITEEAATIRLSRAAQKQLLVRTGRGLYFAPQLHGLGDAESEIEGELSSAVNALSKRESAM